MTPEKTQRSRRGQSLVVEYYYIGRTFKMGARSKVSQKLVGLEVGNLKKVKRMMVLYAVLISLWSMMGKENRYFYIRHSIKNAHCLYGKLTLYIRFRILETFFSGNVFLYY